MQRWLLAMVCLLGLCVGCQKDNGKPGGKVTKEELQRRARWAVPNCRFFCKKTGTLCKDFLAKKKRSLPVDACTKECAKNFALSPKHTHMRMFCSRRAKNCDQIRSCNRCGFFRCKKVKNRWVADATKPKQGKKAPALRREAAAPKPAQPTSRAAAPKPVMPAPRPAASRPAASKPAQR